MTDQRQLIVVLPGIGGSVLARPDRPQDVVWDAGKGDIAGAVFRPARLSLDEAPHLDPVLAATVGEDVGVMLSVVVCGCMGMSKAPPGIRGGAFEVRLAVCCSPCRRDRPGVIQR